MVSTDYIYRLGGRRIVGISRAYGKVKEGQEGRVRGVCVSSMLVGERTTAATRVSESADIAAMLDPDYALLPCSLFSNVYGRNSTYYYS